MANVDLKSLPIDKICRSPYQPRKHFDPEALQELALSIQSAGLLQPIVVRPIENNQYEIIAGERRWRATQLAGLDTINCLVKPFTDTQAAEAAAIENISRVDLNPIEVANAYQRLIDEFDYLHDEVAAAMGISRVKVTNALRLLRLDPTIQALIIENRLSEGHGKVLAGLTKTQQLELTKKCLARSWSVRKLTDEAKKLQQVKTTQHEVKDADLHHLERTLSDYIGCKASIQFDDGHGQLKIDFHNIDVLDGLFKKLGFSTNAS